MALQVRVLPTAFDMAVIHKLDPRHWRVVKRLFDSTRQRYFTVEGAPPQLTVDVSVDELRTALGECHFTNSWELSYRYEGEDLNMRQPVYVDDEYGWYQLHVRGFAQDDGTVDLHAHLELEPTEHPYGHIKEVNFSVDAGQRLLEDELADVGIDYEVIGS